MVGNRKQRKNGNLQLFFAIVFYVCCIYKIIGNQGITNLESQNFFFTVLNDAIFYCLLSIFLLTINAIALLFVMRRQELIELKNYQPALFYLLLNFVFSAVLNPLALFVGLVFILGIFQNLFDYEENNTNQKLFRYGFCVGILALFHFPLVLLFALTYLACITYRRFSFRIFLLSIVSLFLPFLYWYSALYIAGIDFSISENLLQMGKSLSDSQALNLIETPFIAIFTILLLFICLRSIRSIWLAAEKTSVWRRKKYYMLLLLFLFSIVFTGFYSQFYLEIFLVMCAIIMPLHRLSVIKF